MRWSASSLIYPWSLIKRSMKDHVKQKSQNLSLCSLLFSLFVLQKRKLQPREIQSPALDNILRAENKELNVKTFVVSMNMSNVRATIVYF